MLNTLLRFRRTRAAIAVIALVSTEACYTYLPLASAPPPQPTPGQRIRLTLTPEGTTELARYLGPNVVTAEGDLSTISPDGAMLVAVDFVRMSNGVSQPWNGEGLVSFPRSYVTETLERTFVKQRSIVAMSALTTVLLGVAILALRSGGAKGGGTNPPPPPP